MYNNIDDAIQALKLKQVKGMLLDRYTASYYQRRDKLKSLLAVKKLELQRDVGVLFNKNREDLVHCLLNFHRSAILRSIQTLTSSLKVNGVALLLLRCKGSSTYNISALVLLYVFCN